MEPAALLAAIALVPQPAKLDATGGTAPASAEVRYVEDASIPAEGYRLSVAADGIEIASADDAGRFYASVTLRQLALPDGSRPCVEIEDAPAFGWRGMHLDVSRHFFGVDDVKRFLDLMAEHKLNRFHWHLADSQGWRLDVPSHPELAAASARRNGRKDEAEEPFAQGGHFFYDAAEVADVLAYAAARHIEVVPEIELPGHFGAVLSAHPEFACVDADGRRIGWNEICAGSDEALALMEDVLDDVCRMFPFGVVHIGGDECSRKRWRECPRCQARIRDEGLADEDELQTWISRRMVRFLEARGKRAIGWDEYLLGDGIPTNAIGMRWRGAGGSGGGPSNFVSAAAMAAAGHDLVMANSRWVYFDYPQGLPGDPCVYTFVSTPEKPRDKPLERVYEFDPLRDIPPELHFRILGGEGCNWTETTPTREILEWKMWPRACALAECVWCGAARKPPYEDFLRRLEVHRARLVAAGVNAAPIPPPATADAASGPPPADPRSSFAELWLAVVDFALPLPDDAGDWLARLLARPPDPADWPAVRAALDARAAALPPADRPPLLTGLRLALAALAGDDPGVAAARADFAARAALADDTPDFLGGSARDVCAAFLEELAGRLALPPPRETPAPPRPAPSARDLVLADPFSATNALWFLAGVPAPPAGLLPNGDDFALFSFVCLMTGDRARLAAETARLLPDGRTLPGADAARAALALDAAVIDADHSAASRSLVALAAFAADPATAAVRDANPSWFSPRALSSRLGAWCDAVSPDVDAADAAALDAARALLRSFGLGAGRLENGREALVPLANLLARLGRADEAEALLREAAGPDPAAWDEAADLVPLAVFLLDRGRPERVLALCSECPAWSAGDLAHLPVYPKLGPVVARALAAVGRTNEAERIARDVCIRFPAADRNGGLAALASPEARAALRAAAAAEAAAPRARDWPSWARGRLAARALLPPAPLPPILPLPAAAARIAAQGEGPWWESRPPYGLPGELRPLLAVPPLPLFADPDAWPATLRDLVSFL